MAEIIVVAATVAVFVVAFLWLRSIPLDDFPEDKDWWRRF